MVLTSELNAFFILLRAGLWNKKAEDVSIFPLSEREWMTIYKTARKQTVQALVYDGVMTLPEDMQPPDGLLMKWTVEVEMIERRNKHMDQVVVELNQLFLDNHIQPILLKGQGVASCYENPLHRVCGDIDWCFQTKEDYESANRLIQSKNIPCEFRDGMSYEWKGILIEHHNRMIDIYNPFCQSFLKKLQKEEKNRKIFLKYGTKSVCLHSIILIQLSVNTHILRHMLAFGIGMRQLCDAARIYFYYRDRIDWKQMRRIYDKLGLGKWIEILYTLLKNDLGMPLEDNAFIQNKGISSDWMLEEILNTGNFGFHEERFGKTNEGLDGKRKNVLSRFARHFTQYVRYAPGEAFWYPLSLVKERLTK